jgi:endonuclease/exonuclease/phosphatase family metal-dependent hydrolase
MSETGQPRKLSIQELKRRAFDPDTSVAELRKYFRADEGKSGSFAPFVGLNTELVEEGAQESALFLNVANSWSRWRRKRAYRRTLEDSPSLRRVVSEGDSWFQYPFVLDDVIDQLFGEYAILSLGAGGDTLANMVGEPEYLEAVEEEKPDAFLLSAGGNDLLGEGQLVKILKAGVDSAHPADFLDEDAFKAQLSRTLDRFRAIFDSLIGARPDLVCFCHGYDYAIPADGRWLGKPMAERGIAKPLQAPVVRLIVDRFNEALQGLVCDFPGKVQFVDCRGTVGEGRWYDELHPTDEGFAAVAGLFRTVMASALPPRGRRRGALTRGEEGFLKDPTPISRDKADLMLARRARRNLGRDEVARIIGEEVAAPQSRDAADRLERAFSRKLEKINLGRDFLPASFLADGHMRAESVCRIRTPTSLGTGFLVAAPEFLMTNNHVLSTEEEAAESVAEFDYEGVEETVVVKLRPDRLFITHERLDFTIVGCESAAVIDRVPVPLLRNPATVARGDRVNIVQHPRGRRKEIAIHDNKVVTDDLAELIRYTTDTEPGSSGSAVFNNAWDLVALHHAGVRFDDGTAENEGIRIAAIVAHLTGRRRGRRGGSREALDTLLSTVPDTSPFLGFFDIEGVADGEGLEVEVPTFSGTRDFIDVGFWNIEHFNEDVGRQRVRRVAEVLSLMSMDAMGLTEVQRPAMERLVEVMREEHGEEMGFVLLDVPHRQDIAVLFDRSTTEVELATDINRRHAAALASETPSGKTAFPREPLFARCTVSQEDGEPFRFVMVVVHFKAFGDAESRARRRLASRILGRIVEDVRERENLPVILGGDMNDELNTDVLSGLHASPDMMALTADDAVSGAISFVGDRHRSLIDHIMVSKDLKLGAISGDDAAIVRLDKSTRDFADDVSDHVPVVIRAVRAATPVDMTASTEPGDEPARIPVPGGKTTVVVDFA